MEKVVIIVTTLVILVGFYLTVKGSRGRKGSDVTGGSGGNETGNEGGGGVNDPNLPQDHEEIAQ